MHDSGPAAVFAGPGSGKTRVVALRAARLAEQGARILVTTFTNDATEEMRTRIFPMLPKSCRGEATISTLHSLCLTILKGQGTKFTLLTDEAQRKGLAEMAQAHDIEGGSSFFLMRSSFLKNTGESSLTYKHDGSYEDKEFLSVWKRYEKAKLERGLKEFDDLLIDAMHLFATNEPARQMWAEKFTHIMVDESQDMNKPQYAIALALGRLHHNVMLVGDPDQSLYAFRGADTETFRAFAKHRSTKVYELKENYRSSSSIVKLADSLIRQDENRHPIVFLPTREEGAQVRWNLFVDADVEALAVGDEILRLHESGIKFHDIAVLFRVNAQAEALERNFAALGIPYITKNSGDFYSRKEVAGTLAYLEFFNSYADEWLVSLFNVPNRKLNKSVGAELARVCSVLGKTMWEHLPNFNAPDPKTYRTLRSLYRDLLAIEERIQRIDNAGEAIKIIRQVVEIDAWLRMDEVDSKDNDRIQNVQQMQDAASHYKTIGEYLFAVRKVREEAERRKAEAKKKRKEELEAVTLCTGHSAKGLEWDIVFATGWSEGILPHRKSEDLAEERRIAYVIATRARDLLSISSIQNWNSSTVSPSQFLTGLNLSGGGLESFSATEKREEQPVFGGLFI